MVSLVVGYASMQNLKNSAHILFTIRRRSEKEEEEELDRSLLSALSLSLVLVEVVTADETETN